MVEVFVSRLGLDSTSNSFVVILQEKDGDRILPIWIGRAEADSIARQLEGVASERPLTHDLARTMIETLGASVRHVRVTHVEDNTFFAELHLLQAEVLHVVDARPSDCIAIALRADAPMYVAEDLLAPYEEATEPDSNIAETDPEGAAEPSTDDEGEERYGAPGPAADPAAEQLKRYLEKLRPEDFGKFRL